MPHLRAVEAALEVSCVATARSPDWMPFCYSNISTFFKEPIHFHPSASVGQHAVDEFAETTPGHALLLLCIPALLLQALFSFQSAPDVRLF